MILVFLSYIGFLLKIVHKLFLVGFKKREKLANFILNTSNAMPLVPLVHSTAALQNQDRF